MRDFNVFFQKIMKASSGDDFLDVRPYGSYGDFRCDGWEVHSRTCYAVYSPFARKKPGEVRDKLLGDFCGAIDNWPEMRAWRLVHNDLAGLSALVAAALVSVREEASAKYPLVTVLPPWGPKDLSWLLRQAPARARASVLGTHGWQLNQDHLPEFAAVDDDPVSASAGRSVAQLVDGFSSGGVVQPLTATAFAGTLVAFLLGDENAFEQHSSLLEQRCHDDLFEAMLTSIVFCVKAVQLWETATGADAQRWAKMMVARKVTIPYITEIVMSARQGEEPTEDLPGHTEDQQKVTMNVGMVTAMTLRLAADHRPEPLVSLVQDLLISIQREPPYSFECPG